MGGADAIVDVLAIGRDAEGNDFRTQFPERRGCDLIGRAMGAIDHDLQPVQANPVGQGRLYRMDIAPPRIVDPPCAADVGGSGQRLFDRQHRLDRQLVRVGEFEAVGTEQLDAVILIRVVAGGDHHPDIGAQFACQQRHARCRHRPQQHHVHADTGKAGDHGVFQHVARQPRILADDYAVPVIAAQKTPARRLPDLHRYGRGHDARVGAPADAVGAEVLPAHGCVPPPRLLTIRYGRCPR